MRNESAKYISDVVCFFYIIFYEIVLFFFVIVYIYFLCKTSIFVMPNGLCLFIYYFSELTDC